MSCVSVKPRTHIAHLRGYRCAAVKTRAVPRLQPVQTRPQLGRLRRMANSSSGRGRFQEHTTQCSSSGITPGKELSRTLPPLAKGPLSYEQVAEFFATGVVVVRGLIPEGSELLERARRAYEETPSYDEGSFIYSKLGFKSWKSNPVFEELALRSPMAQAARQLTPRCATGEEEMHMVGMKNDI
eukprot:4646808-Pyramimonas_sp.AAC.1